MKTYGDLYEVDCPYECGGVIKDLWGYLNLREYDEIECPCCGRKIKVLEVITTIDITLETITEGT
jgi:uncharacterized Zn-finger protein